MKKKEKAWNALDAFWILLILISLCGIVLRWYSLRTSVMEAEEITVTLRVSDMHPLCAACIETGESLYLSDGEVWGRLVAVERVATPIRLITDGKEIVGVYDEDDRIDVLLRVRVSGTRQGELFLRNGRDAVCVGDRKELFGKRIRLVPVVVSVENRNPEN